MTMCNVGHPDPAGGRGGGLKLGGILGRLAGVDYHQVPSSGVRNARIDSAPLTVSRPGLASHGSTADPHFTENSTVLL